MRLPLLRSRPGRIFLITSILLVAIWMLQSLVAVPVAVEVVRKFVSLAWIASVVWLGMLALRHYRFRLMWRVRRKLILSYLFLGLVPVVLAAAFVLAVSVVLYTDVAAYVFRDGFQDVNDDVQHAAEVTAADVASIAAPGMVQRAVEAQYESRKARLPALGLAVLSASGTGPIVGRGGSWTATPPPSPLPTWVMTSHGAHGMLAVPSAAAPNTPRLVLRSVVFAAGGRYVVVADLPIDDPVVAAQLQHRTGMRIDDVTLAADTTEPALTGTSTQGVSLAPALTPTGVQAPFRQTKVSTELLEWPTGRVRRAWIQLEAPLGQLYVRLAAAQSGQNLDDIENPRGKLLLLLLTFAAALLIVQAAFFYAGLVLARSITTAVHELLLGTERVQRGHFTQAIPVTSNDQLGDLAESFNRMSASIPRYRQVEAEKQRVDDELRIAREIQQSLLPIKPPALAGLSIAAICEPAREVGGDYYDFFDLGPRQLGVLIADVSGKGTSAALYMAELKGLMLALSQTERSPRKLLIAVNRLLAGHLDSRSFITMTYAVFDLDRMMLTVARAGHTPLIVVSGGKADVVLPSGMILGLGLPGAAERFESVLEEHARPLVEGDLITLYTDGITEAMDVNSELFGDATLARVLASSDACDATALRERVLREVRAFVGDAEPHDDMTMVIVAVTPVPALASR